MSEQAALAPGHLMPARALASDDAGENNRPLISLHPRRAGTASFAGACSTAGARPSKENAVDKAYLEDLAPGQVFTSDARTVVDADAIKRFGGEFDPQPWHLNEAVAHSTFFKELVASGWHTTALTMQLIIQTLPLSGGIIGSGVDELRWPRPVRPGDTLRLHCEIIDVQESKLRPTRGTVRVRMTTLNQNDQPVQTMIANLLAFRRPEQA
jgi:acyl dehydratase